MSNKSLWSYESAPSIGEKSKDRSNGIHDGLDELFADSDQTKQNEKTAKWILDAADKSEKLVLERAEKVKKEHGFRRPPFGSRVLEVNPLRRSGLHRTNDGDSLT